MADFTAVSVRAPGEGLFHAAISDLCICPHPGGDVLYVGTLAGGGLSAFSVAGGTAQLIGQVAWSGMLGTLAAVDLCLFDAGSGPALLAAGLSDAALGALRLTASGAPGAAYSFAPGGLPASDITAADTLQVGDTAYLAAARDGSAGLSLYRLGADAAVEVVAGQADAPRLDAVAAVEVGGTDLVVGASARDNALAVWRVAPGGALAQTARVDAQAGLGFDTPGALATADVQGISYVIAAGTQSSSLSVFRLMPDGRLVATDHVVDDLSTRFQSAPALTTFATDDGRTYVLAGGHDDGASLFTLLPDGRLIHLTTIADTAGITLSNVSALAASVAGTHVQVFVASGDEAGMTQLDLDLGPAGILAIGGAGTRTGSAGNDLLQAGAATTMLDGGAGDDILVVTAPATALKGGSGADLFVVSPADGTFRILDFEPAQDRLDLSSLPELRNADQILWEPFAAGVRLHFGTTTIEVLTAAGISLTQADFPLWKLLNLTRLPPAAVPPLPLSLVGTAAADRLSGGTGDDQIAGADGADSIWAGAGNDTASGGIGDDLLSGEDGNDLLQGEDGNDTALGGAGNDVLAGGAGTDSLSGEDGDDTAQGGLGNDLLTGGNGNDSLSGEDGNDQLYGGPGEDWLSGGTGTDLLAAGTGADTLSGGAGSDTFLFVGMSDSPANGTVDRVEDFASGIDRLDLSALQIDRFISGSAFSGNGAELRSVAQSGGLMLSADLTGDGRADFELFLAAVHGIELPDLIL